MKRKCKFDGIEIASSDDGLQGVQKEVCDRLCWMNHNNFLKALKELQVSNPKIEQFVRYCNRRLEDGEPAKPLYEQLKKLRRNPKHNVNYDLIEKYVPVVIN